MANKHTVNVFWFRRDLRLFDNAGFYHALRSAENVLPLFIFDRNILDKLEDQNDSRVTFIRKVLTDLNTELNKYNSSIYVKFNTAEKAWEELLNEFNVKSVFTNNDYEPYARERDLKISTLLSSKGIEFNSYKDHLIFEKDEVLKNNNTPFTVYTPYKQKWLENLVPDFHLKAFPSEKYLSNLLPEVNFQTPSLKEIGFEESALSFPDKEYKNILNNYDQTRDFPALNGTSQVGVHLRFGTLSIRQLAKDTLLANEKTWLSELIWREFYFMLLWHFPYSATSNFKKEYDKIRWRNDEKEFSAWCEGKTGYPLVDAGMRQLNATGWMHNRLRMITASFLCKHLLIDWRWGEAYFARKLIDYEMASNVGGWQWAAGTGSDAVPYFRIFSPDLQTKRFDPDLEFIKKWVPEFNDPFLYPKPIVPHKMARERALKVYKEALMK